MPESILAAALGIISALFMAQAIRLSQRVYLDSYVAGFILQPIGFYWLFSTISFFGGFDLVATSLIFLLFIALSAFQYPIFVYFYKSLPGIADRFHLRLALAWVLGESLSVRIFPWYLGHTQLAFSPLAQIADLGGATLVSLVCIWMAELVRVYCIQRKVSFGAALVVAAFLLYGTYRTISPVETGELIKVALLQANISVVEKHDRRFFSDNINRYVDLQTRVSPNVDLVVWPEAVLQDWIPAKVGNVTHAGSALNFWRPGASMLLGALTFDSQTEIHNSAISILPDGSMPYPYHKKVLMPFGEYTPFLNFFPWLGQINITPEFTPGREVQAVQFPFGVASPLICYEDVVEDLSREAALKGANFLVNLTNDGWFGDSLAPYQHNLIAAFRSIENRRFLIRATNTGLSSIIDPQGNTVKSLPIFGEGILEADIGLNSQLTIFSKYGQFWSWFLLVLGTALLLRPLFVKRERLSIRLPE